MAVWQSDGAVSAVNSRVWNGAQWEPVNTVASGENHMINPVVCTTPEDGQAVYWQEGRSDAVAMASVLTTEGWSAPFQPVSPGGPVWNPVASGGSIYWAGTQGGDWNIYTEVSTGIQQGSSPVHPAPVVLNNPVNSNLSIMFSGGGYSFTGIISLYDIAGRKVLETPVSAEAGEVFSVDCSSLPSGIYSLTADNFSTAVQFTLLR